jgi:DNA modification methylase
VIPSCKIIIGDCLDGLRAMPSDSVHCIVTSPPYYGLRDYQLPPTQWSDGMVCCLGLEPTPQEFIRHIVEVFRELRRVLRRDGTCWMNMGDSYCGKPGGGQGAGGQMVGRAVAKARDAAAKLVERDRPEGLKPKDMMGMPWRLAFALQDDGWWLRQDIIWHKPNPMPESVHDRCCKSHEYIFLLTKSARYFYDAEAVKEPVSGTANARGSFKTPDGWDTSSGDGAHGTIHRKGREKGVTPKSREAGFGVKNNESFSSAVAELVGTRHKRSVWTITTEACKDAHFATFPTALVKPCILAGTSAAGCCSSCGAPFHRVIRKGKPNREHQKACGGDVNGEYNGKATKDYAAGRAEDPSEVKARILRGMVERETIGWAPNCKCQQDSPIPCTVVDPFGGSGTTGLVALELGRSSILLELNPDYAAIASNRTNITPGLAL